jgi:hypothetical protein
MLPRSSCAATIHEEIAMDHLLPDPDAEFYWRTCTINMRQAAERYGPIDVCGDTAPSVHLALAMFDRTHFAEGFGPASIASLSADQLREWMHVVSKAWTLGITAYPREPVSSGIAAGSCDPSGTWAQYRRAESEWRKNEPKFECAWTALRALNILSVVVDFSGEGDDGEIGAIDPEFDIPAGHTDLLAAFRSKEVLFTGEAPPIKLEDLIAELSENILYRNGVPDWCNNVGGCGTLEWQVNADGSNVLNVTVHQRVIEYDTTVLTYDRLGEITAINHKGRSD